MNPQEAPTIRMGELLVVLIALIVAHIKTFARGRVGIEVEHLAILKASTELALEKAHQSG